MELSYTSEDTDTKVDTKFPKILLSQVYHFICYFQAETQRTFIAEKTRVSAPDPTARDVTGGRARAKTRAQLKAIVSREVQDASIKINVFDSEGTSLGLQKLGVWHR